MFLNMYIYFSNRLLEMQRRHVMTTAPDLGNLLKSTSTSSFIFRVPVCGLTFWRSPGWCFRQLKSGITISSISSVHLETRYQNCTLVSCFIEQKPRHSLSIYKYFKIGECRSQNTSYEKALLSQTSLNMFT
jgi:hypothetical protein